ncbi:MAG: transcriptional regulator NrdR [Myxococcota bacterium]
MKCPYCQTDDDKVIDTRPLESLMVIRRRRECLNCGKRFTTYERIEEIFPMIVKKDGRREVYERRKVVAGLQKACEKRKISSATLEKVADEIEMKLQESEGEVTSSFIGELVMEKLKKLDKVAYVRFASVYRDFKDVGDFVDAVRDVNSGLKRSKSGSTE